MGEAKMRRQSSGLVVYHHTSMLRTNLIWMSGVVQLEGHVEPGLRGLVLHPELGQIITNANLRRSFDDFPRLAWFTSKIDIPRCLMNARMIFADKETGEIRGEADLGIHVQELTHSMALNRMAIGFPIANIPVMRWKGHSGYQTNEGRELNESAREVGDDPDDWWVSEVPVDLLEATEVWISPSVLKPKLKRFPQYLPQIRRMVTLCRERSDAYIPPSWMTEEQQMACAKKFGVPVV